MSSGRKADLPGILGCARPVRTPTSPHHSLSLCLPSALAHNSARRLSPAAIRKDKQATPAPTNSLPCLALCAGSLEHGYARHCPATIVRLVRPGELPRAKPVAPSVTMRTLGDCPPPEKTQRETAQSRGRREQLRVNWEYQWGTQRPYRVAVLIRH